MWAGELCQYLDWDSEFFGRRIARAATDRLSPPKLREIQNWCTAHSIDCLYFLADPTDPDTSRLAQDAAFRLVDIRVTLERHSADLPASSAVHCLRSAVAADVPALQAIARSNHRDSRFYYDPNFPRDRCDALYETWIEKSIHGYADEVLVADGLGGPAGYISCHMPRAGTPSIGLFAVAENAQGRGIGTQLVHGALHWFAQQGAPVVRVVTQGRNVRAQSLYQKCGFRTRSVQLWFHYWPHLRGSA
jgi:dTDP-4-amino-4,6-dideoxy-D-galactose acyltransferase